MLTSWQRKAEKLATKTSKIVKQKASKERKAIKQASKAKVAS
jgi:hypothetical protein